MSVSAVVYVGVLQFNKQVEGIGGTACAHPVLLAL